MGCFSSKDDPDKAPQNRYNNAKPKFIKNKSDHDRLEAALTSIGPVGGGDGDSESLSVGGTSSTSREGGRNKTARDVVMKACAN